MINTDHAAQSDAPKGGLIVRTLTRLLMRPARVTAVEALSPHFRVIHFGGDSLRDCDWSPGHKIQVKLDGLVTRTYTPIDWDRGRGATRILAYLHGAAPGSDWARAVAAGAHQYFLGPRRSLNLQGLPPSTVLVGDETSFGLAAALHCSLDDKTRVRFIFEVDASSESQKVLEAIGVRPAVVIERRPDDAHLSDLAAALTNASDESAHFVLSGKSSSIQHVIRTLKSRGVRSPRIRVRPTGPLESAALTEPFRQEASGTGAGPRSALATAASYAIRWSNELHKELRPRSFALRGEGDSLVATVKDRHIRSRDQPRRIGEVCWVKSRI